MEIKIKEKVSVLFLIDTLQTGGAEKSIIEIILNFTNIEVVVVQLYEGSELKHQLIKKNIPVYELHINNKYGFKEAVKKITNIIKKFNPDIIHSTLIRSDLVARRLKKKYNIPTVNSLVSNSYSLSRYKNLSWNRFLKLKAIEFLDKKTVKYVDLFISNSHIIKKDNLKILGIPSEKIIVIPRGRYSQNFVFNPSQIYNYKKKFDLKEKRIILNVSRLIESKGQLDLIKAYSNIKDNHPESVVLIAGEGEFRSELEKEIKKLNLQQNVFLLGNRNDIPQLLAISDLFVFPSYLEGMPGSLIEAMLSKKEIICSDIPENRECLPITFNKYFTPGNISELTNLLSENLNQFRSNQVAVQEIYNFAIQNYEIDIITEKYEDSYIKLLKKNNK